MRYMYLTPRGTMDYYTLALVTLLYPFGLAVAIIIMIFIETYKRYSKLNDYVGQLGIKVIFTILYPILFIQ